MKKIIEIKNLVKKYDDDLILNKINFTIYRKNFISIIGPNGCGKSTLVKIIADLENATYGTISKLNDHKIGFVFQNYNESLLPWRNVYRNISLPFEITGESEKIYKEKVIRIIKVFNLEPHLHKYPHQLSGGLSQLTVIARALVNQPNILILDEPFKSLDFDTSQHIIKLVIQYCEKKSITTILVSHDIDQAILFADKIFVLSQSPSSIKEIIDVKIQRPRKLDLVHEKLFFKIKKHVLETFENENK